MQRLKVICFFILIMTLVACSHHMTDRGQYWVDNRHVAIGQNERIRFLIIHYTAVNDDESLRLLTQEQVSSHYLVSSFPPKRRGKPVVYQLVDENKRAWHAGVSAWKTRNNLNDTSIGIEIVGLGFTEDQLGKIWYPFHQKQIELVEQLARDIIARYQIAPTDVLAHSDIAPLRKFDPGPLFPWQYLAEKGIGAWPDSETVQKHKLAVKHQTQSELIAILQKSLLKYGYHIPQTGKLDQATQKTIAAFQMHFRPKDFSGNPDVETAAIALALIEKYYQ